MYKNSFLYFCKIPWLTLTKICAVHVTVNYNTFTEFELSEMQHLVVIMFTYMLKTTERYHRKN